MCVGESKVYGDCDILSKKLPNEESTCLVIVNVRTTEYPSWLLKVQHVTSSGDIQKELDAFMTDLVYRFLYAMCLK